MASGYFGFTPGTAQFSAGSYAPRPAATPAAAFVAYPGAAVQTYTYAPVAAPAMATAPIQAAYSSPFQTTSIAAHPEIIAPAGGVPYVQYTARPPAVATYYTPPAPTYSAPPPAAIPVINKTYLNLAASSANTTYSGYDAAVYAAASNFLQQSKSVSVTPSNSNNAAHWLGLKRSSPFVTTTKVSTLTTLTGGGGTSFSANAASTNQNNYSTFTRTTIGGSSSSFNRDLTSNNASQLQKRRGGFLNVANQNRPMQTFYCDVCKISCAGQLTYKEHVDSQRHKKKEAQAKSGQQPAVAKTKTTYKCDVCGVTCTGHDTYLAHARGVKHQKVGFHTLKLHISMGKPVTSTAPIIIPPSHPLKVLTPGDGSDIKSTDTMASDEDLYEKDVEPVGADYIEPQKGDDGKLTAYFCKLCDCKFNDIFAKDMHLKGRRHRLQFKKKVNPDLEVDVKVTPKMRRIQEDRLRRDIFRQRHIDMWSMRMYRPSPMMIPPISITNTTGPVPLFGPFPAPKQTVLRGETVEDKYLLAKHSSVVPTEDEGVAMQRVVGNIEKALKMVSDVFAERDNETTVSTTAPVVEVKTEDNTENVDEQNPATNPVTTTDSSSNTQQQHQPITDDRILKGVMRVGDLAKQLVLRGDLKVNLIVLCSKKPTFAIVRDVYENLPIQFSNFTEEKYEISLIENDNVIFVVSCEEPRVSVTITLTSVHMRDISGGGGGQENEANVNKSDNDDPPEVLDKQKCLEALANLRRAKWFQARCSPNRSCIITLRVMKDLCQRISTWSAVPFWGLELLVEKLFVAADQPLSPAETFRHLFETIASGILLECGPGIYDPCEKDPIDAFQSLSIQQREDITASAQHALRMVAFGQIYKILGMEKFPPNPQQQKPKPTVTAGPTSLFGNDKSQAVQDNRKRPLETETTENPEAKKIKTEPQ